MTEQEIKDQIRENGNCYTISCRGDGPGGVNEGTACPYFSKNTYCDRLLVNGDHQTLRRDEMDNEYNNLKTRPVWAEKEEADRECTRLDAEADLLAHKSECMERFEQKFYETKGGYAG